MLIQNPSFLQSLSPSDTTAMLRRLVGNLRGFAYRRHHDPLWTMEWVSDPFRSITGYDPHRFIQNQSLSFAQLILPEDRPSVEAQISDALNSGRRTTVIYRIMAAHRAPVAVEDRLVGVCDASGAIVAVEGIISYAPSWAPARFSNPPDRRTSETPSGSDSDDKHFSNLLVSSHEQA